ncbi:MAG: ImmA/IrrE family metallo-endopeptidase [Prevotella sp.]|jgi:Zn-dependent peptidase ImmA (M78 family)|nr:ImmA/IrrE family metallo-endopeptidase [Prevotella sp.]
MKDRTYKTREQRMEEEANYFARCILIPEVLLRREYKRIIENRKHKVPGLNTDEIEQLSKLFAVEVPVMTMRLVELDIIH